MRKNSLIKMDQQDSKHVKEQGETFQEAHVYLSLAEAYTSNNEFQPAIDHYEKALEIAKEREYKLQETQALLGLGHAYRGNNQFQTAIDHHEKALEIAMEHGNKRQETNALLGLGDAHRMKIQFQTAIYYYEKALGIAKEHENKRQETYALLGLAHAYKGNNQFQTAIDHHEKALEIAKEHEYNQQETEALLGLGYVYIWNRKFLTAIHHCEKALEIAKEHENKRQETYVLLGLGDAYRWNNRLQTAIVHYEKALEIAKEHEYKQQETDALLGLGYAYRENRQFQTAIDHYEKALEIARKIKHVETEKRLLLSLGQCYQLNNQFQNAVQCIEESLQIYEEPGNRNHGTASENTKKSLSKFIGANEERNSENAVVIQEREPVAGSTELWKWEKISIVHREKFINLREYGKTSPKKIKEVGAVRFCCMKQFLIGKGTDGTRVYVGLGKDGYERAVKCLPKDAFAGDFAEKEKELLNEPSAKKSNHVINYYFFDNKSDDEYFFLIMDLCKETLETFVHDNISDDLVKIAPEIIEQVLKGITDLHRDPKPILHRDVKPANVLRDVEGVWLLADFGISRLLAGGATTHQSKPMGTEDWIAVESHPSNPNLSKTDDGTVRYKKESDIQAAGMVAFYIVTNGEHPFGEKPDRLRNLLDGKPVGLETLKNPVLKDLLSWMLSYDTKDRPSAEEALKHPYFQSAKQQLEMLCKVGSQPEIKKGDTKSDVVRKLNSDPKDWRSLLNADILQYLSTDPLKGYTFCYKSSWTDCLRLIRNVKEHWHDRPRPRPELFYSVGDPQEYFLNLFPNLPVEVHIIVRSCDWKERYDLQEYFI